MQKIKSRLSLNPGDTLVNHVYHELIPRPTWRYIGANRLDANSNPRSSRSFAIRPMSTPGEAFVWDVDCQGRAVEHGFFLHRTSHANAVNVIAIGPPGEPFDTEDGLGAIAWLERMNFEQPFGIYWRALRFINQQDQWGYSGAWDERIQFWTNTLKWYRTWRISHKTYYQMSQLERNHLRSAKALSTRAVNARKHSFASHIRRNFILAPDK